MKLLTLKKKFFFHLLQQQERYGHTTISGRISRHWYSYSAVFFSLEVHVLCGNRTASNSSCSHRPPAILGRCASFLVVFKIHCINSPWIE